MNREGDRITDLNDQRIPNASIAHCLAILMVIAASGASCPRGWRPAAVTPSPVAFATLPSIDQIRDHVNSQTSRVRMLQTTGARLHVPGAPALSASLAVERPQRLRMQANLGFTGAELDLGSNEHEFWFWAKRNEPPGVYFARQVDAASPAVRNVLPIPPSWLTDALGLIELGHDCQYQGPFQRSQQELEIRTTCATPSGTLTRVILIDAQYGFVVEQQVYDAAGRMVARARTSSHAYDAAAGVSLPRTIDVQLPTMPMEFRLEVDGYVVNQLTADPAQLWQRPDFAGYPAIDLARQVY